MAADGSSNVTGVVKKVVHRDIPAKGNKAASQVHNFWLEGKKGKIVTFSSTAGPIIDKLRDDKTECTFNVSKSGEFQGEDEFTLHRITGPDNKIVYEPEQRQSQSRTSGYKTNPEWSFTTPEERQQTRRSIEAQKAAGIAVAVLGDIAGYDESVQTAEGALAWVEKAIPRIAAAISGVSGSPSQMSGAGGGRSTARPGGGMRVEGSTPPQEQSGQPAPATPPSAPATQDVPTPGPDASTNGREPVAQELLDALIPGTFESMTKLSLAYRKFFDRPPVNIYEDELEQLLAAKEEGRI